MAKTLQATKHKHVEEILKEIIDEIPFMEAAPDQKLVQTSLDRFVLSKRVDTHVHDEHDKPIHEKKLVQIPMDNFVLPKRVIESKWCIEDEVFNLMMPDDDDDSLVQALEYEQSLLKDSKTDIVEREGHPSEGFAHESGIALNLSVEHTEQLAIANELPAEEFWGDWVPVGMSLQNEQSMITPDLPDVSDEFWEDWVE